MMNFNNFHSFFKNNETTSVVVEIPSNALRVMVFTIIFVGTPVSILVVILLIIWCYKCLKKRHTLEKNRKEKTSQKETQKLDKALISFPIDTDLQFKSDIKAKTETVPICLGGSALLPQTKPSSSVPELSTFLPLEGVSSLPEPKRCELHITSQPTSLQPTDSEVDITKQWTSLPRRKGAQLDTIIECTSSLTQNTHQEKAPSSSLKRTHSLSCSSGNYCRGCIPKTKNISKQYSNLSSPSSEITYRSFGDDLNYLESIHLRNLYTGAVPKIKNISKQYSSVSSLSTEMPYRSFGDNLDHLKSIHPRNPYGGSEEPNTKETSHFQATCL